MAKVSQEQISNDEKKVIAELEEHANDSIETIAKRCGFSRQKVWRIIKKLEANQTIWGYHAVIDTDYLQVKNFILLIKKTNQPISGILDIILSRDIEINAKELGVHIHASIYLHGFFDWIVFFSASDLKYAKKFSEHFNQIYQNYVGESYLIEQIFPIKLCGIVNPNKKKLKEMI